MDNPAPLTDPGLITAEITVWAVVLGFVITLALFVVFVALLVRAARYPMPVPLIAPLAMLALVAMVLGAVIESAQELIPIGGAAVGALAAVLTSVFHVKKGPEDHSPDTAENPRD
jgi:uncharacterized membrane protein YhaH (DUF805 family)